MKGFMKPKLILSLVTVVLLVGAILGSLAGNFVRAHAQAPASISFKKSATPAVAQGGTITYTLTLKNTSPSGTLPLHDITLTDTPPSPTIVSISGPIIIIAPTPTSASVNCSQSTTHSLSCFVDNFAPGVTVSITFTASVSKTFVGKITNTATAQSSVVTATATASTMIFIPPPAFPRLPPELKNKYREEAEFDHDYILEPLGMLAEVPGLEETNPELAAWTADAILIVGPDILVELLLAADAPDRKFTVIAQPVLPAVPQVHTAPGFTDREADAANALDSNLAHTVALERTLLTSMDRAQGAALAKNKVWEAKQLQAAWRFAAQLAELLEAQPQLLNNVQDAGFPTVHIPANLGGGTFPQVLTNRSLVNAILQTAEALEQFARSQ